MSDASDDAAAARAARRLAGLEKMVAGGKADALTWYGLAMEYKSQGRLEDAERTFIALRDRDPAYVPMYYQAGAVLLAAGRKDEARAWLEDGVERARAKGDTHALSELEQVLAGL